MDAAAIPDIPVGQEATIRRPMVTLAILMAVATGCATSRADLLIEASGGDTTTAVANRNAFGTAASNLDTAERRHFEVGNSFFTRPWVTAPSDTPARDGLGPLFNATSCSSCHVLDGRAAPPTGPNDPQRGLLLRIGIVRDGVVAGHPVYGSQIQDRGIAGVPPEATVRVEYEEQTGSYPDGSGYSLRRPTYRLDDLAYGEPGPLLVSPRIGPAVFGIGLLEAVPADSILAIADPDDADGDGISGRPNRVWSESQGSQMLGRFGWKATTATVTDQVTRAFLEDIGITSSVLPDENCTRSQVACNDAPQGGRPELSEDQLRAVVFYATTIAVPQRRDLDAAAVRRGAELFVDLGCAACHTPTFTTGDHPVAAVANQVIHPFTDLLLHDMGPGLDDSAPDGLAGGSEWRTPPLWGLGLIEDVNGHTFLLHDGRARSIEEAILWHGGEAASAQRAFVALDAADRARVIAFLESL